MASSTATTASINGDNATESSSSGNEMTAEWVVKAQLKITQPKKKAASFTTSDCGARRATGSPCRIVYKWSSDDKKFKNSTEVRVGGKRLRFVQHTYIHFLSSYIFLSNFSLDEHNHAMYIYYSCF